MAPADRASMRLVPCLFAPLFVAGCFDSYGPGGPDSGTPRPDGGLGDYVCHCCGVDVLVASEDECLRGTCDPYCLFVPDAGTDAPLDPSCGARPIDLTCLDHVPAGRSIDVEVTFAGTDGECFCGQEIVCAATITGDHQLALSTSLCPLLPICRACEGPPVGACTLPPLTEGSWRVRLNGVDAHDLDVTPPGVFPEPADVCIRRALPGDCGITWPPSGFAVHSACHADGAHTGTRVPITVTESCGGCTTIGPCEVSVVDGHLIRVSATSAPIGCDFVCPPVCSMDEHVCFTPPLPDGDYQVVVDGLAIDEATTIHVGSGVSGTETCAGG